MAIAESVLFQINSTNYTAPIATIYKPPTGWSGFVTTLRLTVNLNSIEEANFPYIPDDTPPDVLQEVLADIALNTEFKEVVLYQKKGDGAWIERAPIRIFNKEPYYDVNLMRYFSDSNTIDVAEDLSLGIQVKTGNVLTTADSILVWGSVVAEKKNNGNEELADRISALESLLSIYGAPSASLPGTNGLVPAPPAGSGEFLLRGDRGWQNPNQFATQSTIDQAIIDKAPLNNPVFTGFPVLGGNIGLKFIYLSGYNTASQQGQNILIDPGIPAAKIRGLQVFVNYDTLSYIRPGHLHYPGFQYDAYIVGGKINIINSASNSQYVLNKPIQIEISYTS